jgi:thiol-disulfide isomerase/thioredoxin
MNTNYFSIYFFYLCLLISPISTFADLVDIVSIEHYQQVINQKQPTIVKFAADWCGVCQGVKEPFKNIAQEKEFNTINFAQVDVDKMKDLSKQHSIAGVPTFVYMQNGKQINQEVGVQNMVTFDDDLRNNVRTTFKLAQNNIHEMTKDNSIPGHIEQNESVSTSKALEDTSTQKPENKQTQTSSGIMGTIKNFFLKIIELIKEAIKYIVDKITGIFR